MDAWSILHALWLFLPAYVANMSPVFTAKLLPRWSQPIDGGRMHGDGQRVLGDGKTWRGLVGGAVMAGLVAWAIAYWAAGVFAEEDLGLGDGAHPAAVFAVGACVGLLALVGDVVESYAKRRRGKERGAPWFPFDQLDFVVGGLVGYLSGIVLLPSGWIIDHLFGDWVAMLTLLVLTPVLHVLVNRIGYWLKLKEVPW